MNEWKSSGGRITLFPAAVSTPSLSALELYRQVWGEEPDSFQRQPNPLMPSVAQGNSNGLKAVCVAQPARIDFNLTPPPRQDEAQQEVAFPLIEDTGLLHSELSGLIDVVDRNAVLRSVVRVALGIQFLALKPSSTEANGVLTASIPQQYGVKITDEEDFIFQINRPYTSRSAEGIKTNFITKWSVDRLQILTFAFSAGGPTTTSAQTPASGSQTAEFIAASVNFDINNVPTLTPLPNGQPASLLREALIAIAQMQQAIGLNIEGFQNA